MLEQTQSSDSTVFAIALVLIAIIHFVPSVIAFSRKHSKRVLILVLNILMGWTVIGWAILLAWSLKGARD